MQFNITKIGDNDFRKNLPRFTSEAMEKNQALVDLLKRIADEKQATPRSDSMSSNPAPAPAAVGSGFRFPSVLPSSAPPATPTVLPMIRVGLRPAQPPSSAQVRGRRAKRDVICMRAFYPAASPPLLPHERSRNAAVGPPDEGSHLGNTVRFIEFVIGDWLVYGDRFVVQLPLSRFHGKASPRESEALRDGAGPDQPRPAHPARFLLRLPNVRWRFRIAFGKLRRLSIADNTIS
jgi:hypothetical protein